MQTCRTFSLATAMWAAFGLAGACNDTAPQGDANPHLSALADAGNESGAGDAATPRGGSSGMGSGGASSGGLDIDTGGAEVGSGVGDEGIADAGEPPTCTADLAAIGCPATYQAALSGAGCPAMTSDHPRVGACEGLRVFAYGHDGSRTCAYDSSTDALVGAISCGIPPLFSSACSCHTAGQTLPDACKNPVTSACTTDAGTD